MMHLDNGVILNQSEASIANSTEGRKRKLLSGIETKRDFYSESMDDVSSAAVAMLNLRNGAHSNSPHGIQVPNVKMNGYSNHMDTRNTDPVNVHRGTPEILPVLVSQPVSDGELSSSGHSSNGALGINRRERAFVPEVQKDDSYWLKRRKNNEAAKKSREKRRAQDQFLGNQVVDLRDKLEAVTQELEEMKRFYSYPMHLKFDPRLIEALQNTENGKYLVQNLKDIENLENNANKKDNNPVDYGSNSDRYTPQTSEPSPIPREEIVQPLFILPVNEHSKSSPARVQNSPAMDLSAIPPEQNPAQNFPCSETSSEHSEGSYSGKDQYIRSHPRKRRYSQQQLSEFQQKKPCVPSPGLLYGNMRNDRCDSGSTGSTDRMSHSPSSSNDSGSNGSASHSYGSNPAYEHEKISRSFARVVNDPRIMDNEVSVLNGSVNAHLSAHLNADNLEQEAPLNMVIHNHAKSYKSRIESQPSPSVLDQGQNCVYNGFRATNPGNFSNGAISHPHSNNTHSTATRKIPARSRNSAEDERLQSEMQHLKNELETLKEMMLKKGQKID